MNVRDLVAGLFPAPVKKKNTDGGTIYAALHGNGVIIERARRRSSPENSMTKMERNRIKSVRDVAEKEHGMSKKHWQGIEMDGERDWEKVLAPLKVKAVLAWYTAYSGVAIPEFHVLKSNHPSLVEHGNYSDLDFIDAGVEPPPHYSYEKWVKKGRPIYRGEI